MNEKMKSGLSLVFLMISLIVVSMSCKPRQKDNQDGKIITVSILPQKYFTQQIAGSHYRVNVMIPPGASPASYEPAPRQMTDLSNSSLYLRIGHVQFEEIWMKHIRENQPDLIIRDVSRGIDLIRNEAHDHDHHEGHHHHGSTDPHIWMSPINGLKIAENTFQDLVDAFPADSLLFYHNYSVLKKEIEALISDYEYAHNQLDGIHFLIYHPALTYLAEDYGMHQHVLEQEGKEPSPSHLNRLIREARDKNIKSIFVQEQFDISNASQLAREIDAEIIPLDPLDPEWKEQLQTILSQLLKISADGSGS